VRLLIQLLEHDQTKKLAIPEKYKKDYRMAVIVREGKIGRISVWMQNTGINRV